MNDLKSLLSKRVNQIGISNRVHSAVAVDKTNEVLLELFGPQTIDYHARAISLKGRCVKIAAMNPAFRQEIHLQQNLIIQQINQKLNQNFVLSIKITI